MTNQSDAERLLPCPFCNEALIFKQPRDGDDYYEHPRSNCVLADSGIVPDPMAVFATPKAITAWNTRAAPDAPQAASQAVIQQETLRETADRFSQAGHDFWQACQRDAGGGAVRWLDLTDGALIIFTRGEYRRLLLSGVDQIPGITELVFESPDDGEKTGVSAFEKTAVQPAEPLTVDALKSLWNSQAEQINQWDELGLDEIVAFAQTHNIKPKASHDQ